MYVSDLHVTIFFFNDTATTEIYALSLHDALPISLPRWKPSVARRRYCFTITWTVGCGRAPSPSSPRPSATGTCPPRSEEHTSELQSQSNLECRLLLEKKNPQHYHSYLFPAYDHEP